MISSKVWIPTGYNFNSAMVCTFKFLVIIPYQPICFCKANHFIRNDKGNWLKNADCANVCIVIYVEIKGKNVQASEKKVNFAAIK